MKLRTVSTTTLLSLLLLAPVHLAARQEHPEHPKTEKKQAGLTKTQLAAAIRTWIDEESARNGGWLPVEDPVSRKTLQLKLVKVHDDRLSQVGTDLYFACADFVEKDGTNYDIDVFMQGKSQDDLKETEVSVHKVNGKERYTWFEEGGVWKKKPAA